MYMSIKLFARCCINEYSDFCPTAVSSPRVSRYYNHSMCKSWLQMFTRVMTHLAWYVVLDQKVSCTRCCEQCITGRVELLDGGKNLHLFFESTNGQQDILSWRDNTCGNECLQIC